MRDNRLKSTAKGGKVACKGGKLAKGGKGGLKPIMPNWENSFISFLCRD